MLTDRPKLLRQKIFNDRSRDYQLGVLREAVRDIQWGEGGV